MKLKDVPHETRKRYIIFHDHTQFRLPRQLQIIALTETSKDAVVEVLSARSTDFKNAVEFQIEYVQ